MKKLIWIGVAVVFAAAAVSAFIAFQSPTFFAGFIAAAVAAIFNAFLPHLLKRKSPEDEKKWREAMRHGQEWDHIRNRPKDKR